MATYQSIRYNLDYKGKAGSIMPLLLFTSDGSDDTADFTTKIDSTYSEYLFIWNSIHGETDDTHMDFQVNAAGQSGFNETITSCVFACSHDEEDNYPELDFAGYAQQSQGTGFQRLCQAFDDNDACASGFLRIYDPSNTTFVKHFHSQGAHMKGPNGAGRGNTQNWFTAGYFNITAAIDEVQFKMSSGEIQGGTIQMFGVI